MLRAGNQSIIREQLNGIATLSGTSANLSADVVYGSEWKTYSN